VVRIISRDQTKKNSFDFSFVYLISRMYCSHRTYNLSLGSIRAEFAESIEANSVHGSDSFENAKIEIEFFFNKDEIVG